MELGHRPESEDVRIATRRTWFRRESISLGDVVLQLFVVVLGILLALAIDDWKKARETTQSVADAMKAVSTELAANQAEMRTQHEHLQGLTAALTKVPADAPVTPCNEYEGWNGAGIPVLLDAAYDTAIATQAFAHMDFDRAETVAAAYGRQRMYIVAHGKLLDLLMRGQPTPVGFCRGIVEELGNFVATVDAAYTRALVAAGH